VLVLVIVLLAAWLIVSVIGFAIKGLIWLGIIGIVLFVATVAIGAIRRRSVRGRRSAANPSVGPSATAGE
jgi:uncharacterized SAM-binding protein YcdF (DUF218 family)